MDIQTALEIIGVIVAVAGIVIGGRYAYLQLREARIQTRLTKKSNSVVEPDKSIYRKKPSPEEINMDIQESPPFFEDEKKKSFTGLKVNWILYFGRIRQKKDNTYDLTFFTSSDIPVISCEVDITEYPEFKIMKNDQLVRVYGEINSIESSIIWELKNCSFEFDIEDSSLTMELLKERGITKEEIQEFEKSNEISILRFMNDPDSEWTVPKISNETGIDEIIIQKKMNRLSKHKLVRGFIADKGETHWLITEDGQKLLKAIERFI